MLGNISANPAVANNFDLLQIHFGGLGGVATPGKVCKFSPHLTLESIFPELKLKQNFYINMKIFFSSKLAI